MLYKALFLSATISMWCFNFSFAQHNWSLSLSCFYFFLFLFLQYMISLKHLIIFKNSDTNRIAQWVYHKVCEENHISIVCFRILPNQLQLWTASVNPFYMRYTYLRVKSPSSFVTCALHCIYPLSQEAPQTPMTKPPSQYMHYFNKIPPL